MKPEEKEWLESLKVGDEVVVKYYHFYNWCRSLVTLERETPKRFYAHNGNHEFAINKADGSLIGWGGSGGLEMVSEERKKEIRMGGIRQNNLGFLDRVKWKDLPDAALQEIRDIVERNTK